MHQLQITYSGIYQIYLNKPLVKTRKKRDYNFTKGYFDMLIMLWKVYFVRYMKLS